MLVLSCSVLTLLCVPETVPALVGIEVLIHTKSTIVPYRSVFIFVVVCGYVCGHLDKRISVWYIVYDVMTLFLP